MTARISLVAALGTALALAAAASSSAIPNRPDEGATRSAQARSGTVAPSPTYGPSDWRFYVKVDRGDFTPRADSGSDRRFDVSASHVSNVLSPVRATGSGDDVEWLQVGVAFGAGMALALALALLLRPGSPRPATG